MITRKHILLSSILIVALFVAANIGLIDLNVVEAESGGSVTVSATVSESVACSNSAASTAFGSLSVGAITTSSPNATSTMSCNSASGCTLSVADAGDGVSTAGLYNSAASYTITSQTAALSIGVEGYGIQAATTSAGTGATLTLDTTYNKTGNNVGALTRAGATLAASSAPVASREVVVTHK